MQNLNNISPECDYGNVEYKVKLVDKTEERVDEITSQMRYRTDEGNGESIYVIGVSDSGNLIGVSDDEFTESFNTLSLAAQKNNYSISMVSDKTLDNNKKVYELLVREKNERKYIDIKVVVAGHVDAGKCESKGTKIRMHNGDVKNIENIVKGDILMGDDSFPRRVLETTSGFGQLYSIIQDDGSTLNINKNHILCFQNRFSSYYYWDIVTKSTIVLYLVWNKTKNNYDIPVIKKKIFYTTIQPNNKTKNLHIYNSEKESNEAANDFLQNIKNNSSTSKFINFKDIVEIPFYSYLDVSTKLQSYLFLYKVSVFYKSQDVFMDPYILGYWLGVNNNDKLSFVNFFNKFSNSKTTLDMLEKHDLTNNKHIPKVYKYNSFSTRLDVIAGIIDSSGNLYKDKKHNHFYFLIENSKSSLSEDIIEIFSSIGLKSYKITHKISESFYDKIIIECSELFDILLNREKNLPDFNNFYTISKIENITILPQQEYFGFELDGNGRYLHEDYTVTHNSSFLGVLTTGKNDDGRGSARLSVFNYKHEVSSGRTSSVAHHILGFDDKGKITNYPSINKKGWEDIVKESSKIISFYDLCGHEKYLRTTIMGITSSFPDMCFIMIGGNTGITYMTQEHIFLCVTMGIPFSIVITKIDICKTRQNVLKDTIKSVNKLLKLPGLRRIPYKISNQDDVILCANNISHESIVPIFYVSNVSGQGIDLVKKFLNLVKKKNLNSNNSNLVEYHVDTTFSVPGVGTVIGGQLISGSVNVGDKLFLGPNNGKYEQILVRSIHCKKVPLQSVSHGSYVCLGLRKFDKKNVRRGNVILSHNSQLLSIMEFTADIKILKAHSTTIKPGYEPIIYTNSMRQTAKLISINNKINARKETTCLDSDNILRTGDNASATFTFKYYPEFLKIGTKLLMADGRCKIIGVVKNIVKK